MQQDFPPLPPPPPRSPALRVVETAFLASTAALIWILSYTPLAPFMRLFFPIPVALAVMRWDPRTGAMALAVSALLLTVLMGPTRSILYVIPYGLLGYWCARLWRRRLSWYVSVASGAALSAFGLVFQLLLSSLLVGENLWTYVTIQLTGLTNWLLDVSLAGWACTGWQNPGWFRWWWQGLSPLTPWSTSSRCIWWQLW